MLKNLRNRYILVKMLHTSLGSGVWHFVDIWYLLTGRV